MPNDMDWNARLARVPGLEINEVTDGFLVYQRDRDRVHFLNATATLVLESCDGTLAAAELPQLVAAAFDLDAPPVDDVAACIETLLREGLVAVRNIPPGE
ncbi:MAG TPA: PqqD family protein [Casimicrobiaceae bacterium]|nr:PqqD family protein [Casimicrobiaceae bacterium]